MDEPSLTDRAMEMLSLYERPKFKEKRLIATKIDMSVRQVYRAWDKLVEVRKERQIYVTDLVKWKSYCLFIHTLMTSKWYPDPEKEFTKKESILLGKIEEDLKELME